MRRTMAVDHPAGDERAMANDGFGDLAFDGNASSTDQQTVEHESARAVPLRRAAGGVAFTSCASVCFPLCGFHFFPAPARPENNTLSPLSPLPVGGRRPGRF